MIFTWDSNNKQTALYVTIKCAGEKHFFLYAEDGNPDRVNSLYAKREMIVRGGERTIYFSFPLTPKKMNIIIRNVADSNDKNFSVSFEERPLKKYNIWLDEETKNFLNLNFYFSQTCGFTPASKEGTLFQSADDKFHIRLFPVIRDALSGNAMSTPARIGHTSGNIDAAKNKTDKYTFAERVIIFQHEFSHKYRNPKMGLAIENEKGADVNALYVYLGLGFSKIDAINVFANVFLKVQSPSNTERMRNIMDFIARFENYEFAQAA